MPAGRDLRAQDVEFTLECTLEEREVVGARLQDDVPDHGKLTIDVGDHTLHEVRRQHIIKCKWWWVNLVTNGRAQCLEVRMLLEIMYNFYGLHEMSRRGIFAHRLQR